MSNGNTTSTDADGNFSFVGISPGLYDLSVNKAGYENMTINLSVTAGSTNALGIKTMTDTGQGPGSSGPDMTLLLLGMLIVIVVVAVGLIYLRRRPKAP